MYWKSQCCNIPSSVAMSRTDQSGVSAQWRGHQPGDTVLVGQVQYSVSCQSSSSRIRIRTVPRGSVFCFGNQQLPRLLRLSLPTIHPLQYSYSKRLLHGCRSNTHHVTNHEPMPSSDAASTSTSIRCCTYSRCRCCCCCRPSLLLCTTIPTLISPLQPFVLAKL